MGADDQRSPGRPSAKEGPMVSREDLLDAALRLIAVHGFDGTSVRALAKDVGVTHGTVQHHFPTKKDLWHAIVEEVLVPALRDRRTASLSAGAVPGEALAAQIRTAAFSPGLPGAILLDATEAGRERLAYLAEAISRDRGSDGNPLQPLVAAGRIRDVDLTALRALIGVGLPLLASAHDALRALTGTDLDDPTQRDAFADGLTDILLHGLLPRDDWAQDDAAE